MPDALPFCGLEFYITRPRVEQDSSLGLWSKCLCVCMRMHRKCISSSLPLVCGSIFSSIHSHSGSGSLYLIQQSRFLLFFCSFSPSTPASDLDALTFVAFLRRCSSCFSRGRDRARYSTFYLKILDSIAGHLWNVLEILYALCAVWLCLSLCVCLCALSLFMREQHTNGADENNR